MTAQLRKMAPLLAVLSCAGIASLFGEVLFAAPGYLYFRPITFELLHLVLPVATVAMVSVMFAAARWPVLASWGGWVVPAAGLALLVGLWLPGLRASLSFGLFLVCSGAIAGVVVGGLVLVLAQAAFVIRAAVLMGFAAGLGLDDHLRVALTPVADGMIRAYVLVLATLATTVLTALAVQASELAPPKPNMALAWLVLSPPDSPWRRLGWCLQASWGPRC